LNLNLNLNFLCVRWQCNFGKEALQINLHVLINEVISNIVCESTFSMVVSAVVNLIFHNRPETKPKKLYKITFLSEREREREREERGEIERRD
jgi:hypothetical protein